MTLGDASELHSGFTHCGRVNRFAATTAAATRTSARRRVAGFAINRKLADQRRAWFTHYDLNDFRCLGVRRRKLAEERRKAAVPAR